MNIRYPVLALFCAWLPLSSAQVSVEVVLSQDKFLLGEELIAGVRVINHSGQSLQLGQTDNWIRFNIERAGGGIVPKLSDPPVQRPFILESARQATLRMDLAPCYDLGQAGQFQISAEVVIADWGRSLMTKPKPFEIIAGTRLWEREFGIPSTESNQPPEIRSYSLQQASYLAETRLFLRIARSDGRVIKLINVGRMLSFGQPEPLLDKNNRLHLLHQTGPRIAEYLVVNPEGRIEIRHAYEYTDSRPRLRLDRNGEAAVSGGVRRVSANDLPLEIKKTNDHSNAESKKMGNTTGPN